MHIIHSLLELRSAGGHKDNVAWGETGRCRLRLPVSSRGEGKRCYYQRAGDIDRSVGGALMMAVQLIMH